MVAREVEDQRVVGDLKHFRLQILQVFDVHNLLLGVRIDDHEIAKTKAAHDARPQILRIALRVLIDERGVQLLGVDRVARLGRLQDKRNDQAGLSHILPELIARVGIFRPIAHEAHVGDDAQHVVAILVEDAHRLLVGASQLDLWAATHAQHALVFVEGLLGEHLALL